MSNITSYDREQTPSTLTQSLPIFIPGIFPSLYKAMVTACMPIEHVLRSFCQLYMYLEAYLSIRVYSMDTFV